MTDIERFNRIDEVRCVCDQQEIIPAGQSWTRENLAWVFEKARLRLQHESIFTKEIYCWRCDRQLADEYFFYCFDCFEECWAGWGA